MINAWSSGWPINRRAAVWLMVAANVAVALTSPTYASFGLPDGPGLVSPLIAYPLGLAVVALQLQHSFAFVHGERPRYAFWTFLVLLALVYVPLTRWNFYWAQMQVFVMTSALMLLSGRLRIAAVIAPIVGMAIDNVIDVTKAGFSTEYTITSIIAFVIYWTVLLILGCGGLYASARMVRMLDQLHETRAELGAFALRQERLRVSRDLHDLLGQSLSAVSLKGDLAMRLLGRDQSAARAEIQSLTDLARETQRGIEAISRDEHAVSIKTEVERATALLAAAGIDSKINMDVAQLEPPAERVLAWAVREAVANVLRHSDARSCTINAQRGNGNVLLEVVNDGVESRLQVGSGLTGLAERARAVFGSASWEVFGDRFKLRVEVPDAAT